MNPVFIVSVIILVYSSKSISAEFVTQTKGNRTIFTQGTICKFPGTKCGNKTGDHFWFTKISVPVRKVLDANETCTKERYEWPGENGTSLCCLDLQCQAGQILAKDDRNTLLGECPKCRNIVYQYICDPLNDTCSHLHVGSTCRHFFNSSTLFICACDAAHGYTQNRLAFPITCTKTIGAVCFLQEHCSMADPNSVCDFGNRTTTPPKGKCQCQSGFILDKLGRCQNNNLTSKMLVKRQAYADWGDKNNWEDGPIQYPFFNSDRQSKDEKISSTISPVLAQPVSDLSSTSKHQDGSKSNGTVATTLNTRFSTKPVVVQPQAFMISAALINATAAPVSKEPSLIFPQQELPESPNDETSIHSSNAVSGTQFAKDDGDSQVDTVLNIIRPARKKLQTGRPTTSNTWDVSVRPTLAETSVAQSTFIAITSAAPTTGSTTATSSITTKTTAAPESTQRFVTVKSSTRPPTREHFELFAETRKPKRKATTIATSLETTSESTTLTTSTLPSTTVTSTPSSTPGTSKSTTTSTTTPSTASETSTTTTTVTTVDRSTTTTATTATSSHVPAVIPNLKPKPKPNNRIPVDSGSGIVKVQLHGNGRFGGVVRLPAEGIIGGVGRPVPEIQDSEWSSDVISSTRTSTTSRPSPSARTTSVSSSSSSTDTSSAHTAGKVTVDLSFLKDSSLSKSELQKRLLQALLDLSATTPTTTSTTTTTPVPTTTVFDLSFLSDPNLSTIELEQKLLPLLTAFREHTSTSTTGTPTVRAEKDTSTAASTESPKVSESSVETIATATESLVTLDEELLTTASLRTKRKHHIKAENPIFAKHATSTPSRIDEFPQFSGGSTAITPKKKFSFFNAILAGLGSVTPRHKSELELATLLATTSTPIQPDSTTTILVTKRATKPRKMDLFEEKDSGKPSIPGFGEVFSGIGALFGSLLSGKRPRPSSSMESGLVSEERPIAINNGKLDMSDPRTQMQLVKLMQQKDSSVGALASLPAGATQGENRPKTMVSANSPKFNFNSPEEQVAFVKFLQSVDKYQPSQSKGSSLFPRPPPIAEQSQFQRTTALPVTFAVSTQPNSQSFFSDDISPEAWALISQMQKPGYYNVTPEQLTMLQPILQHIQQQQPQTSNPSPSQQPPAPQFIAPPSSTTAPNRAQVVWGGDPYSTFGAAPPVPPVFPEAPPAQPAPAATTTTTKMTITTSTSTTTAMPKPTLDGQGKSYIPSDGINQVAAPLINPPNQPPFVQEPVKCSINCKEQDSKSVCDTRFGNCVCQPGYRVSFLEGNICTQNIFSLCSTDDDCTSGGDIHSECAFNGDSRFCTCSNGYLPDADGTCQQMFSERCSGICSNIPNAVCDSVKGVCKCPTGYAWFKDPWTGQPVCSAALSGSVPCRSEQDLCPIYTPRGKCRNNVFCGCDDGYIPDSWFTNQRERTSCIDVLSAKCEDNSDCTAADLNTLCDRRLRMCVCKPGYKPDSSHNTPCMVDPNASADK